jgi:hypothetical protein
MVEVRNQARVHLWFQGKFGDAYAPLSCTDESFERYLCPAYAVGVRLQPDGEIDVAAPFGLEDLFAMRLRPNPRRPVSADNFARAAASARARWPEATVEGAL